MEMYLVGLQLRNRTPIYLLRGKLRFRGPARSEPEAEGDLGSLQLQARPRASSRNCATLSRARSQRWSLPWMWPL